MLGRTTVGRDNRGCGCRFIDGISAGYADSFEKVAALRSRVAAEPRIKEMYAGDTGYEP